MNLESAFVNSYVFTEFKEIEKRKLAYLKLGSYAEISLEIFEKLGCQDLYQASLVCKEWKLLVKQTSLWKKCHSGSVRFDSQEEKQLDNNKKNSLGLSSCPWTQSCIARLLWQDSTTVISDSLLAKVNVVAAYLHKEGYELKGVPGDGDCFFSSFLGSYKGLSRKIPLLDDQKDKISYLRQVLASTVKRTDSKRAEEIIGKGAWVSGLGEGELLASALSIPVRLVTVNEEGFLCGIHDRLIFSQAGLAGGDRSQEWETIPQEERPQEYILIADLGGHFIYAQKPLKQDKSFLSKSKTSSDILFSNSLSMNALKNTLEIGESQELLSDEGIKELEQAYTLALQTALQKKDVNQESFFIEKLGDVYVGKGTSEALLQAAGLYNYALRRHFLSHSLEGEQKALKKKLSKVQDLLVKECKGRNAGLVTIENQFESNRKTLKEFRKEIEEKIKVLGPNPSSEELRKLYTEIAHWIKAFFKTLVNQAQKILELPPCEYSMIGFGSLAREEMTPYSDLEFGILIQEDTFVNRDYFRRLTTLLHLKVINLGETILPALNISSIKACIKEVDFFDSVTPRGFAFDGEGAEGKGCKTPFGNHQTFELIQTPEKMAQYIAQDENGKWWHQKEPHLPMELLTFTHLLGNEELTRQYTENIQEKLNTPYQKGLNLRQHLAKEHLVQSDMATFEPGIGYLGNEGMLFKVKNDLYRFPHLALDRLALLKGLNASDTFTRIDQLNELRIITNRAAIKLKEWMSIALFMRLKTYFHYQAQREMMNPLLKSFGFDEPGIIQKQFALDQRSLENIKHIYHIFIPFYKAMQGFFAGDEDSLNSSILYDESPKTQGHIAMRLFQYEEAKEWYIKALINNSEDSGPLIALGGIYLRLGKLKQAINCAMRALKLDRKLFGKNNPQVAIDYTLLGMIYEEIELDKAVKYIKKAIKIDYKFYGKAHPMVASRYNSLGQIYQKKMNLEEAVNNTKKAIKIDLKFYDETHPIVKSLYNNLGLIYSAQGNFEGAIKVINNVLEIDRTRGSENYLDVPTRYNNLAMIYQTKGNLEQADKNTRRARDINVQLFGEHHPAVAQSYSYLGEISRKNKNLNKAVKYINKALEINLKYFGESHPQIAECYNDLAKIYKKIDLKEAVKYAKKALEMAQGIYGENHPKVATFCNDLGYIYLRKKDLEKAIQHMKKALNIDIRFFGKNHPYVCRGYNSLGSVCVEKGNLEEAKEYANKALEICCGITGKSHQTMIITYYNLGVIYKKVNNLEMAIECVDKALKISEEILGKNNLYMVRFYQTLGSIHETKGDSDKAVEYSMKAIDIGREHFGENHSEVAICYSSLGDIYLKQGKLEEAAQLHTKALSIDRKVFGENHPNVASDYYNRGKIYQQQGSLKQAIEYIEKALSIDLKFFGENHSEVAICYSSLGGIYLKQGKLEGAAECFKKALAINLKVFGENHPQVATDYNNLGQIYHEQGNLEKAAKYYKITLSIDPTVLNEKHRIVAIDYIKRGTIYYNQGNLNQAAKCFKKALAIDLKIFGEDHINVAGYHYMLGMICQKQGNLLHAAQHVSKKLAIDLKFFGENHPALAACYNTLGLIYQKQGNLKNAAECIDKALAIGVNFFDENHPAVANCYNNLGLIYQAQGNPKKAAECTDKARAINRKLSSESSSTETLDDCNLNTSNENTEI
ncbi:tetratricopeptide repeat protein [Neochlamydia sp. AcF95]|uniref:tetratricopeptide repeat protein n=1 Tax=Neochlamydia sp. AcF95 TaxID=2795734 RepID=UPI001BC9146B|nr:tetratricopeptide repeat protein [Neochlamydia sp. AcF95]MBS4170817.1 Uncharacterized protein [Neochlamydia sp. AcF95]